MPRKAILTVLAGIGILGCLPNYYKVSFPEDAAAAVPRNLFSSSGTILAFPCWYWTNTSTKALGPPVTFSAEELPSFPEKLGEWRGFEIIDLFDHEGLEAPLACGAVLIGDSGAAVRLKYRYVSPRSLDEQGRFYWQRDLASIGPRLKAAFAQGLADRVFSSENLQLVFDLPSAKVLGDPESLEEARRFIGDLEATGDDEWRPDSL